LISNCKDRRISQHHQKLRDQMTQDNVSIVAAVAGSTALQDRAALEAAIKRNADDRQEFSMRRRDAP
jgi:hypothetical protein